MGRGIEYWAERCIEYWVHRGLHTGRVEVLDTGGRVDLLSTRWIAEDC